MAYLHWQGPSELDGSPIALFITDNSTNKKTGAMLQTWILRTDMSPTEALRTENDDAVCGDCVHRQGSCYVLTHQAPQNVYRQYINGKCKPTPANLGLNAQLRAGAYGDPAAVPYEVWDELIAPADFVLGYTHQWHNCDPRFARFCMASVENANEAAKAQKRGWRTFRVMSKGEDTMPNEALCPASEEAGKKLQCHQCRACNGTTTNRRSHIAIPVHGARWKVIRFQKNATTQEAENAQA